MAERASILVVEDEHDTADMLAAYFESQGYQVHQAAWGQDALKIATQTSLDLILLDIRLPDIDGYEICRQLRQQRRTQDTPIIFLTEKRERLDKLQGLELGAVDYITKPFDIQELKLRVRNALRRASFETLTDPVTGLPSEPLVRERLHGLLQKRGWAVMDVSVAGLEAFGDVYGFVARDDALRALALMLTNVSQESSTEDSFVGQTGQAEFVVITDQDHARDLRERLVARLKQSIGYFYPFKDERGRTQAGQRPEIKILLSVVGEQQGPFADPDALLGSLRSVQRPV
jgi:DNA-binding response OmpR family regulator